MANITNRQCYSNTTRTKNEKQNTGWKGQLHRVDITSPKKQKYGNCHVIYLRRCRLIQSSISVLTLSLLIESRNSH